MKTVVFVNSHPVQYVVPLYQQLARTAPPGATLRVLYLTDETIGGYTDRQFGTRIAWDVPLLDGYDCTFVPNDSWKPSHYNGFFGLLNWGLLGELRRLPPNSLVISHGWAYASNVLALWAAKAFGHRVGLRGESPLAHEWAKSGLKKLFRRYVLRWLIFSRVDEFFYIGEQNRLFYKSFGIADASLSFAPYAVDNVRFRHEHYALIPARTALRTELNMAGKTVILFTGKLVAQKRPLDLWRAFRQLRCQWPDLALLFVGDGELRSAIEAFCALHQLTDVLITGFVNQGQIARYYTVADVFVMCSGLGETWGLAVNEAMNFGLPVMVSDLTGCGADLVGEGQNGFGFQSGSVGDLVRVLSQFLSLSAHEKAAMGADSLRRIAPYSYDAFINLLTHSPVSQPA